MSIFNIAPEERSRREKKRKERKKDLKIDSNKPTEVTAGARSDHQFPDFWDGRTGTRPTRPCFCCGGAPALGRLGGISLSIRSLGMSCRCPYISYKRLITSWGSNARLAYGLVYEEQAVDSTPREIAIRSHTASLT